MDTGVRRGCSQRRIAEPLGNTPTYMTSTKSAVGKRHLFMSTSSAWFTGPGRPNVPATKYSTTNTTARP